MAVGVAGTRRLFTREEYHRMAEVGILKATDRVELIRGEIVEMSPIGRRHYAFVNNLNQLLAVRLAGRAIVAVQGPIALADDTEPEAGAPQSRTPRRLEFVEEETPAEGARTLRMMIAAGVIAVVAVSAVLGIRMWRNAASSARCSIATFSGSSSRFASVSSSCSRPICARCCSASPRTPQLLRRLRPLRLLRLRRSRKRAASRWRAP